MTFYSLLPGLRFSILAAAGPLLFSLAEGAQGQNDFASSISIFLKSDARIFEAELKKYRPPVDPALVAASLTSFYASLPENGEVKTLNRSEQRKLALLDSVLSVYERKGVYPVKIVSVQQAAAGLYERTILWISQSALNLLSGEELQAFVAHEMGHEYVWEETRSARETKDFDRQRQIELFCDAIAILTLRRSGINPSRLIDGIEKMNRFNEERFGTPLNAGSYPTAADRKRSASEVVKWAARSK